MSVLKSIFHRYNKTTSSYDTLHPETEHAQITDFGQGVIAHLASNVLASTISSITSDSLMAKLVKLVFNATGVQYNIAQNGYVKFGDLFGGLIIQWGTIIGKPSGANQALPINATNIIACICGIRNGNIYTHTYSCAATIDGITAYSDENTIGVNLNYFIVSN
jgi:hypothetical protein